MSVEEITENKEEIMEKAWKNDKKFIEMTVDIITDYFEKTRRMLFGQYVAGNFRC